MRVKLKPDIDLREKRLEGWLRVAEEYVVLAVEQLRDGVTGYRLVSEDGGQPVLFEAELFDISDASIPESWSALGLQGATLELGPENFGEPGFWERVFDREPGALEAYRIAKKRLLEEG